MSDPTSEDLRTAAAELIARYCEHECPMIELGGPPLPEVLCPMCQATPDFLALNKALGRDVLERGVPPSAVGAVL